ncbi:alpha/beta fold hydrolase [Novosphingobium sp. KN65.2]|uniref:alpha/beta fold hydrolase n=1 Tax=Novosphingobium sp. KN65.2 TaxID=1478134 RepID=UPI0005DA8CA8|nr:alpha/beta hydrolase [Novosphingobium sp. KN65.2]CDO36272.1 conserved hypothetical protein [Novosphingobium sp. KN65.2]
MKLLFCHGWGFDRHFWDALAPLLGEWEQYRDDRGYFGDPLVPAVEGPCLAITHSFGTMRILADPPPGLAGIVAINGFERFTAAPDSPGVPTRVVDLMLRRFDREPRPVVEEFRQRVGCDEPLARIDPAPLREDLLHLRDSRPPLPQVPVLIVQAGGDPLLPEAMREACFVGVAARHLRHESGGHLLPFEDPAFCAQAVRDMTGVLA